MYFFYYTNAEYLYVLLISIYNSITIWFHFFSESLIIQMDCSQAYQLDIWMRDYNQTIRSVFMFIYKKCKQLCGNEAI